MALRKNLILRRPRSGRLEGRTALIQAFPEFCKGPAFAGCAPNDAKNRNGLPSTHLFATNPNSYPRRKPGPLVKRSESGGVGPAFAGNAILGGCSVFALAKPLR